MLKIKRILISSLVILVLVVAGVLMCMHTEIFNNVISTTSKFLGKSINSVDDIKNVPSIVEITETQPLDSFVRQFNQRIAEGKLQWSWTNGAICYNLRYKSDEYTVQGFLSLPDDYLEKEYPVLIYNRGGDNTCLLYTSDAADD